MNAPAGIAAPAVEIVCADALTYLDYVPSNTFDLVLCDPPYGTTQNRWDDIISLALMWEVLKRVRRSGAPIVMTCSQPFTSLLVASNIKEFQYEWVWDKIDAVGHLNAKRRPMQRHENIAVFCERTPPYNPQDLEPFNKIVRRGHNGDNYGKSGAENYQEFTNYPRSIIQFKKDSDKRHPTQKPVDLFRYLIRTYSNPGDHILDFCAGSGTTGVAAQMEGRRATLIDLDPEYCEIARKRLANA